MFRQSNLKILLAILVVLGAIFAIVQVRKAQKGERTFRDRIVSVDTGAISGIVIHPRKENKDPLKLTKKGDQWHVVHGETEYRAHQPKIRELKNKIHNLQTKSVVGLDEDSWEKYEVTDSMARPVDIMEDGEVVQRVLIGKFKFEPSSRQRQSKRAMMRGGRPQGTRLSYVRIDQHEKVYSVEGFLKQIFQPEIDEFRDQTVVRSNPDKWTQLIFNFPADSSFTLKRGENGWLVNGDKQPDSNTVQQYLSRVSKLSSSHFLDPEQFESSTSHVLKIEGKGMDEPIKVTAAPADSVNQYVIRSSMNDEAAFSGKKGNLFDKVFVNKQHFFEPPKRQPPERKASPGAARRGRPNMNKEMLKRKLRRQQQQQQR